MRPEAQALWPSALPDSEWDAADAIFTGDTEEDGAGRWRFPHAALGETWPMRLLDVAFLGRFTAFRHVGVFPEQIVHWAWMMNAIKTHGGRPKVLNLFGYTGVASLAAAAAGAEVTHVDASKKAIGWGRENQALARMTDKPIRWICDDAMKFIEREQRRGNTYDIILTDPPRFGRGPEGEVWQLFDHLPKMLDICRELLSPKAIGLVLTAYSIRASFYSMHELMMETMRGRGGLVESGELIIREDGGGRPRALHITFQPVDAMTHDDNGPRRPGQVKEITSLSNPIIKDIKALSMKKNREESGTFMAEGLKLVIDALEMGWRIETLMYAKSAKDKPLVEKIAAKTVASGGQVLEVSEKVLSSVTRRDNPQMVVGIFHARWKPLKDIRPQANETWLALDRVRDPGNLGTIIRTADAAGASGVILVGDTTDPFAPRNGARNHGLGLLAAGHADIGGGFHQMAEGIRHGDDRDASERRRGLPQAGLSRQAGDPADGQRTGGAAGRTGRCRRYTCAHPPAGPGGFAEPRRRDWRHAV